MARVFDQWLYFQGEWKTLEELEEAVKTQEVIRVRRVIEATPLQVAAQAGVQVIWNYNALGNLSEGTEDGVIAIHTKNIGWFGVKKHSENWNKMVAEVYSGIELASVVPQA